MTKTRKHTTPAPTARYGCICGWSGTLTECTNHPDSACPRCKRHVHKLAPCPKCHTAKHVQVIGHRLYRCHQCDTPAFDDDQDEGGDYSDRNPSARLEREERWREEQARRRAEQSRRWR